MGDYHRCDNRNLYGTTTTVEGEVMDMATIINTATFQEMVEVTIHLEIMSLVITTIAV
jgi:hypothetical protein